MPGPVESDAHRGDAATRNAVPTALPAATVVAPGDVLVAVSAQQSAELTEETILPATGIVRLSRRELAVMDHPAFQRLFEVYQLGQSHLVYRGATHTRGEHSVGSVEMATKMVEATMRNAAPGPVTRSEHWQPGERLTAEEVAFVRLGALLHDIGHLPAGHTLEDELGILPHHDGDARINLILDRAEWRGRQYEPLRSLIDELFAPEAATAKQVGEDGHTLTASELLIRLVSSDQRAAVTSPGTNFRVRVCRDLIGDTICADLLDYLHRDFLHLGKPLHFDPRLLDYLEVVTRESQTVGREDRLIINLKGTPRPRPDAVTAILDLLERRYQLAEIALFHRVKLSAAAMLERVIAEYRDTFKDAHSQQEALQALVPDLLECSDTEMLTLFERKLLERRPDSDKSRVDGAVELASRLRIRKLHRDLHILYEDDLGPEGAAEIARRFSGDPDLTGDKARDDSRRAAEDRLRALRTMERDFGLRPGQVVMYCPSLRMNMKIAEVGIYLKGTVGSLARLDERNSQITGGHLKAQQQRFRRLWRISFAIDEEAYRSLEGNGMLPLLRTFIKDAVLWIPPSYDATADDAVRRIAENLTRIESSPWFGRPLAEPALNREQSSVQLPGGAPSITSFMGQKARVSRSRKT